MRLARWRTEVIAQVRLVSQDERVLVLDGDASKARRETAHVHGLERRPGSLAARVEQRAKGGFEAIDPSAITGPDAGPHPGDVFGDVEIDRSGVEAYPCHGIHHRGRGNR